MFDFNQLSENRGYAGTVNKTALLKEVGRIACLAYEQGATLDEVRAICGAAFGDWYEAQTLNGSEESFLTREDSKVY